MTHHNDMKTTCSTCTGMERSRTSLNVWLLGRRRAGRDGGVLGGMAARMEWVGGWAGLIGPFGGVGCGVFRSIAASASRVPAGCCEVAFESSVLPWIRPLWGAPVYTSPCVVPSCPRSSRLCCRAAAAARPGHLVRQISVRGWRRPRDTLR